MNSLTVPALEARIAELENEVLIQKSYASEYHADCAMLEASLHRVNQERGDMHDEIEKLKRINTTMLDRLTVMADARYQGVTITPRQANWMVNMLNGAVAKSPSVEAHNKQVRVNRLATSIKNRIQDGHPSIAIMLCAALME